MMEITPLTYMEWMASYLVGTLIGMMIGYELRECSSHKQHSSKEGEK